MTPTPPSTYAPTEDFVQNAHVDAAKYDVLYAASIEDPEGFWREQGKRVDWIKPFTQVKDVSYDFGNVGIKWYADGTLNVAANCVDRHLAKRGDQTAIIWEPAKIQPNTSPTRICTRQSAKWQMFWKHLAFQKAIGW